MASRSCRGTFQPERLDSLEVDRQFILDRRLDRQIGGLLALEDAIEGDFNRTSSLNC